MTTVIGPETRIAGALSGDDDLEVHGTVDGPVQGEAAVTIAAGARIGGEVRGRDVTVGGELSHAVFATGLVRLLATAKLTGDIEAPRVAIDEGAVFDGQIRMRKPAGVAPPAARPVAPTPTPTPPAAASPRASVHPTDRAPQANAAPPANAAPQAHAAPPANAAPPAHAAPAPRGRDIPELASPGRKPLIRKSS